MRSVLRVLPFVALLAPAIGTLPAQTVPAVSADAQAAEGPSNPRAERMGLLIALAKQLGAANFAVTPVAQAAGTAVMLDPYIVRSSRVPAKIGQPSQSWISRFQETGKIAESADKHVAFMFQAMPNGGGALAIRIAW